MFDGEMVKRNFPFEKKIWTNFWSKTMLDLKHFWSKTMLEENFLDKVGLKNFWSKTILDLENFWSKTKLDMENFHHISFLA